MPQRDVVAWNSILGAYAQNGKSIDAGRFYERMLGRDVISANSVCQERRSRRRVEGLRAVDVHGAGARCGRAARSGVGDAPSHGAVERLLQHSNDATTRSRPGRSSCPEQKHPALPLQATVAPRLRRPGSRGGVWRQQEGEDCNREPVYLGENASLSHPRA
ncbi:uncharacterized protein LOC112346959 isoform X2 [Selaginella moellendorffii]|uniref:uncharacterized protein LOC112346959 isoform X2 n=1 Tax=Selaginella moellendorffii TaxID=88036 RepID=UPI000D1CB0B6|nr:uncharacterized protein LOC112346959 isoform X2 [Selaginella moellendorffii]|eukprot:XP_024532775.1 uncharacterized protein LOC112346959 isoform X2 [Selaginella moellendorffii]